MCDRHGIGASMSDSMSFQITSSSLGHFKDDTKCHHTNAFPATQRYSTSEQNLALQPQTMSRRRRNTSSSEESQDPPPPKRARALSFHETDLEYEPTSTEKPKVHATYGQQGCFPGLGDENEDDELFYGPASNGIEYLRMVR